MNSSNFLRSPFVNGIVTCIALVAVGLFAIWWFNPIHVASNFSSSRQFLDIVLFLLVSYIIWHPILMEVLSWVIASHIKEAQITDPSPNLKVAFITTIVPANESLSLLHRCLPAMVQADYKHDTWLLDEGDSDEVRAICHQYGVKHFSRTRSRLLNSKKGKYVKKTKGGNHNAWYRQFGNDYDIVAQIDTDFVPKKNFLTQTLGYFNDPKIAFVGTPQIYGNTKDSFIARGAAEQLYNFYGTILRGLSGMRTTLLIGANHVIRVGALKDVNHYSAHITEDLLTGMKLHKNGWKSTYVPTSLAVGEGPFSWEAYFSQQMRWAYGCIDILFFHTPKFIRSMGIRRAIYYFLLQQHYFSGLVMALSIGLLSLYFFTGLQVASIDKIQFFAFYSAILLICWLMSVWLQRYDIHSKSTSELLLAGKVISIATWPIYFIAFFCVLIRKRLTYKVTPKGDNDETTRTNLRVFTPHFIIALIAAVGLVSSFFTGRQSPVMLFWAATSTILMLSVPFSERIVGFFQRLNTSLARVLKKVHDQNSLSTVKKNNSLRREIYAIYAARKGKVADCLFLSMVTILSFVFYLPELGFYTDDWSFLGNFSVAENQSLWGLFQTATTPNTLMRPVQNLYDAGLYFFFGVNPLGYHIVNGVVMLGITIVFYLVLRRLRVPRIIAIAAPLLYILLPNYSANRFWFAVFQANLSIFFYFFSLYAGLVATSIETKKVTLWKVICIGSLILCGLSYEVALPLALVSLIVFWYPREDFYQKYKKRSLLNQPHKVFLILHFVALSYVLIFKAMTTIRLGGINFPEHPLHVVTSAIKVNYGTFGVEFPYILGEILSKYWNTTFIATAIVLYLGIFFYLYYIVAGKNSEFPNASWLRNLTIISFGLFILGYAIFFTNTQVGFSPTGVENRVAIAASIGFAFSLLGGFGFILRKLFSEKVTKVFFCLFIAIIGAGGFLVINTLAVFWGNAYQKGQTVLRNIEQDNPKLISGATLIVDGVCPYVGPAPVFEAEWDLKGALQTRYNDPTLKADIVTPRLTVKDDGIYTQTYTFITRYPYEKLQIYNYQQKESYPITNEEAAREYFQKYNPDRDNNCPHGDVGNGVDVFSV